MLSRQLQIVFSLVVLGLFSSCQLSRRMESSQDHGQQQDAGVIQFLVFRISQDSVSQQNVIELISQARSEGSLKHTGDLPSDFDDYLTVEVFDRNRLTDRLVLEHPLHKHIEYADESGKLETKNVELKSADFFVRIGLPGNSPKIRVSETLKNGANRELKTFRL